MAFTDGQRRNEKAIDRTKLSVELGCSVLASLLVALIFIVQVKPLFARWLEIDLEMGRFLFLFAGVGIGTFLILQCAGLVFFGQFSHTATTSLVPKETVKPLLLRRMAGDLTIDDQYPVHRSITGCHGANAIRKSKKI